MADWESKQTYRREEDLSPENRALTPVENYMVQQALAGLEAEERLVFPPDATREQVIEQAYGVMENMGG